MIIPCDIIKQAMNVDSTLEASRTRGVNGAGQHEAANSAAMEVEPVTEVSVLSGVPFRGPLPLKKVVGHKGSSSVSDPTKPRNKVVCTTESVLIELFIIFCIIF